MSMHKMIVVSGIKEKDLLSIVYLLQEKYADTEYVETIDLYTTQSEGCFLLKFLNNPDFEHFCFFVNLIKYSGKTDGSPDVVGYWDLSAGNPFKLDGNKVMLYISSNDDEYDNVIGVTDRNVTYKLDFAFGKDCRKSVMSERPFFSSEQLEQGMKHLLTIMNDKEVKKREVSSGCLWFVAFIILLGGSLVYVVS